jgi:hypothetical protein
MGVADPVRGRLCVRLQRLPGGTRHLRLARSRSSRAYGRHALGKALGVSPNDFRTFQAMELACRGRRLPAYSTNRIHSVRATPGHRGASPVGHLLPPLGARCGATEDTIRSTISPPSLHRPSFDERQAPDSAWRLFFRQHRAVPQQPWRGASGCIGATMRSLSPPVKRTPKTLMQLYASIVGTFRSNRFVFRILFSFSVARGSSGPFWDWTTLALKRALQRCNRPGARFLDMGTGPFAVLALYVHEKLPHNYVCGTDHDREIVESARRAVELARADIDISESSLFDSLSGKYDFVVFNAPYIDTSSGIRLGLLVSEASSRRWSGGVDGTETIDRFLASAAPFLRPDGRVLLGVNLFYVQSDAVRSLIRSHGWSIDWTISNLFTRAIVYGLKVA